MTVVLETEDQKARISLAIREDLSKNGMSDIDIAGMLLRSSYDAMLDCVPIVGKEKAHEDWGIIALTYVWGTVCRGESGPFSNEQVLEHSARMALMMLESNCFDNEEDDDVDAG